MNRYRGSGARLNGFSASPKKLRYTHLQPPDFSVKVSLSVDMRSRRTIAVKSRVNRAIRAGVAAGASRIATIGDGAPELASDGEIYRLWIK